MELVILRCGDAVREVAARRGEFASWIRAGVGDAWRGGWREYDLRTDATAPAMGDAAGFIITGSSSNMTQREAWMAPAMAYLARVVESGAPVLGICFGHQILAEALGGRVTKNPRGREIGTVVVTKAADDPLFAGLGETFSANATHVEVVAEPPKGARILATTALDPVAAYAIGERVRCVQFHPEIDADAMRGYIGARAHFMRAEGLDPEAALAAAHDADGPTILKSFVRAFVR
jgi:GMP synthase (glutamine-hydrolysing)